MLAALAAAALAAVKLPQLVVRGAQPQAPRLALAPGVVRTELAGPLIQYLESHNEKPNLMNMIGEPEDIARLVRYLATEEARYVTGEVVRIDGGELL